MNAGRILRRAARELPAKKMLLTCERGESQKKPSAARETKCFKWKLAIADKSRGASEKEGLFWSNHEAELNAKRWAKKFQVHLLLAGNL